MKTKKFQEYLKKRLSKEEIADIEAQAKSEIKIWQALQKLIIGIKKSLHSTRPPKF